MVFIRVFSWDNHQFILKYRRVKMKRSLLNSIEHNVVHGGDCVRKQQKLYQSGVLCDDRLLEAMTSRDAENFNRKAENQQILTDLVNESIIADEEAASTSTSNGGDSLATISEIAPDAAYTSNSYKLDECRRMSVLVDSFIRDNALPSYEIRHPDDTITLVDNVSKQAYKFLKTSQLTYGDLRTIFENVGHSLSFCYQSNYVCRFSLDIDCVDCKKGSCQFNRYNNIGAVDTGDDADIGFSCYSAIKLIADNFRRHISKFLNRDNVTNKFVMSNGLIDYSIFQRRDSCSMHIYFNFSTSIILSRILMDDLRAEFGAILENLSVDCSFSTLALPYSAKRDGDVYIQRVPAVLQLPFDEWRLVPSENFFDLQLSIVKEINFAKHKPIGSIVYKASQDINEYDKMWNVELEELRMELVSPLPTAIVLTNAINSNILLLRNSSAEFTSLYDENISVYLNQRQFCGESLSLDLEKFIRTLENDVNKVELLAVHGEIKEVAAKFYKLNPDCDLMNLVKYIVVADCAYSFYWLCALSKRVVLKMSENSEIQMDYFNHTLRYFLLLVNHIDSFRERDFFSHIINSILKVNVAIKLFEYTQNPSRWLSILSDLVFDKLKIDIFNNLFCDMFRIKSYENLVVFVTKYLKRFYHHCRTETMIYIYKKNDGLFRSMQSHDFVNSRSHEYKLIILAKIINVLEYLESHHVYNFGDNKLPDVAKRLFVDYAESLDVVKGNFNMYLYFISTDVGVFNTITGSYMLHTPLLLFNTKKSYCTVVGRRYEQLTRLVSLEDNAGLQAEYNIFQKALDVTINKQNDLFYLSILVPGLLSLPFSLDFGNSSAYLLADILFKSVRYRMQFDEINFAKLYYLLPVVSYYNYNIDTIATYSLWLADNFTDFSTVQKCINAFVNYSNSDSYKSKEVKSFQNYADDWSRLHAKKQTFSTSPDGSSFYNSQNINTIEEELQFYKFEHLTAFLLFIYEKQFDPLAFSLTYITFILDENYEELLLMSKNCVPLKYSSYCNDCIKYPIQGFDLTPDDDNTNLYSVSSLINFKRAYYILTDGVSDLNHPIYKLLYTYSQMFSFDSTSLDEFLTCFSIFYSPSNPRKTCLFLFGSKCCGKTQFIKLLSQMHGESVFNTSSNFLMRDTSSGPAQDDIRMYSSYMISVSEVTEMNPSKLKAITGDEDITKRGMYKTEHVTLSPLPYVVCTSNSIPNIHPIDEALRERFGFFEFRMNFVKLIKLSSFFESANFDHQIDVSNIIDDNPWIFFSNRHLYMGEMNPVHDAQILSTLLYVQFKLKCDDTLSINTNITNPNSCRVLRKFYCKNSKIYDSLDRAKIFVPCKGARITIDELTEAITDHLPKDMDLRLFIKIFKDLFIEYKTEMISNEYIDIGFKPYKERALAFGLTECFVNCTGNIVTKKELMKYLRQKASANNIAANTILYQLMKTDCYDKASKKFIDVKLR